MPMTTTSTYSPHSLPADVPLPVEADGTIRIWFAMRELRFASAAESTLFSVKYEGAESVSRAKITTFLDNYKTVVVLAANPVEAFEAFALQMEWVEAAGGGVENENITVREAPLEDIDAWLAAQEEQGIALDPRIFTGLYFLKSSR